MKLSVGIIVSYETDHVIKTCLDSIFESLKFAGSIVSEFEVIVITSSIWKRSTAFLHKNIRIIPSDSNNLAINRNLVLLNAKYEAIYFTDPDCKLANETIRNLIAAVNPIAKQKFFAVAGANISSSSSPAIQNFFYFLGKSKFLHLGSAQVAVNKISKMDWHAPTCNILYLRNSLQDEIFHPKYYSYGEDLEFNFRLHRKTQKGILIANNAPVMHQQYNSFRQLVAKFFCYGMAQTHLFKSHNRAISNKRIWLLFGFIIWLLTLEFFDPFVSRSIFFSLISFYLAVFTYEIISQKKYSNYFEWLIYHIAISLSYLFGQFFAIFTRRSKRIFASGEM